MMATEVSSARALESFAKIISPTSIRPRPRDGRKRETLEKIQLLPEPFQHLRAFPLIHFLAFVQGFLEPREVPRQGGSISDVALPEPLKLSRVLDGLESSDGRGYGLVVRFERGGGGGGGGGRGDGFSDGEGGFGWDEDLGLEGSQAMGIRTWETDSPRPWIRPNRVPWVDSSNR
jgi:hypothetical protein